MTTTSQKYDVKDLIALSSAVAHTAVALDGLFLDGHIDLKDLARVPELFNAGREFLAVDWVLLVPEASDLDEIEKQLLSTHFQAAFNLTNDTIEGVIETGFSLMLSGIQAFQSIRAIASAVSMTQVVNVPK